MLAACICSSGGSDLASIPWGIFISGALGFSYCSEKFPEVAQAFQPVRITEAGETPALRPTFHNLWVSQRLMNDCLEKSINQQ
jgi:hypothetical protein